jgi:NAD(P)-dependent dehydrogenase (short-subunit alcohol dehydrogenase family)
MINHGSFADKVVAVTGGGSGIGFQIVKHLYDAGAAVHIIDVNKEKLEAAKAKIISGDDSRIFCHQCDISQYEDVAKVFRNIKKISGNVYGLVNNAGINPSRNDISNTAIEDWMKTLDVNLTGAFNCAKAAIEQMLDAGKGSIVNIASVGGLNPFRVRTSYNVSKFGLVGLSHSLAIDYADRGIRINAVCPGYVRTELTSLFFDKMEKTKYEKLVNDHAMKRLGKPEEIAKAVLFLLSEDASFITGVALPVDGGYLLKG